MDKYDTTGEYAATLAECPTVGDAAVRLPDICQHQISPEPLPDEVLAELMQRHVWNGQDYGDLERDLAAAYATMRQLIAEVRRQRAERMRWEALRVAGLPMLAHILEAVTAYEWPMPLINGITPAECFDCPFATALYTDDEMRRPNWMDPGEGYYACSLLHKTDIWGENPKCTDDDWRPPILTEWQQLQAALTTSPPDQQVTARKAAT